MYDICDYHSENVVEIYPFSKSIWSSNVSNITYFFLDGGSSLPIWGHTGLNTAMAVQ